MSRGCPRGCPGRWPLHVRERRGKAPPLPDHGATSPSRCPGPGQVSSPCFRSPLQLPRGSEGRHSNGCPDSLAAPWWTLRLAGGTDGGHPDWLATRPVSQKRSRAVDTPTWAETEGRALGRGCAHAPGGLCGPGGRRLSTPSPSSTPAAHIVRSGEMPGCWAGTQRFPGSSGPGHPQGSGERTGSEALCSPL